MECRHCSTSFHFTDPIELGDDFECLEDYYHKPDTDEDPDASVYAIRLITCPACTRPVVILYYAEVQERDKKLAGVEIIYPPHIRRPPVSEHVPNELREDFEEAVQVLAISPKASAALARRVLQHILEQQGYEQRSLQLQIKAVLEEKDPVKVLPVAISQVITAIQELGNFSTHPSKNQLNEIIKVEAGESEWCLAIIEDLFEHYYVKPAMNSQKLKELQAKRTGHRGKD